MPKDKLGNQLTWKEYMDRWKEGMKAINPYQIVVQQLIGMKIIILGLSCGIIVSLFNIKQFWWLLIILLGGMYVNITQYLATWQKKKALEKFYGNQDFEKDKEVKNEQESTNVGY